MSNYLCSKNKTNRNTIELTRKLIEFDTTNPPGNEEECIRFIGDLLENAGFCTDYYYFAPQRPSLIARLHPPATAALSQQLPICFQVMWM